MITVMLLRLPQSCVQSLGMNERGSGHTGIICGQLEPMLFLPWGYLKEERRVGDVALVGGVALPLELSSPGAAEEEAASQLTTASGEASAS